ncbi:unnamed protein product, partial [Iphiclides podalirius]
MSRIGCRVVALVANRREKKRSASTDGRYALGRGTCPGERGTRDVTLTRSALTTAKEIGSRHSLIDTMRIAMKSPQAAQRLVYFKSWRLSSSLKIDQVNKLLLRSNVQGTLTDRGEQIRNASIHLTEGSESTCRVTAFGANYVRYSPDLGRN